MKPMDKVQIILHASWNAHVERVYDEKTDGS